MYNKQDAVERVRPRWPAQSHSRSQGLPQPVQLSLSRRLQWASNQVYLLRYGPYVALHQQLSI